MTTTPDMPAGEFGVIYADTPWSYENGGVPNGGVDKHYNTMDIDNHLPRWCKDSAHFPTVPVFHIQERADDTGVGLARTYATHERQIPLITP